MRYETKIDLKNELYILSEKLGEVSVRGGDVENMYHIRLKIKSIFENIEVLKEEKEIKEEVR